MRVYVTNMRAAQPACDIAHCALFSEYGPCLVLGSGLAL